MKKNKKTRSRTVYDLTRRTWSDITRDVVGRVLDEIYEVEEGSGMIFFPSGYYDWSDGSIHSVPENDPEVTNVLSR